MTSSVIYYSTETRKNEILNNSEHLIQIFQGKIFIQECQRRILRVGGGGWGRGVAYQMQFFPHTLNNEFTQQYYYYYYYLQILTR